MPLMETDPTLSTATPYQAIEWWRQNHEWGWGRPYRFDALEDLLDPALKQLRDHDDFTASGLAFYAKKAQAFAAQDGNGLRETWTDTAVSLTRLLVAARENPDGSSLLDALHDADMLLLQTCDIAERAVLQRPPIARRFLREVLRSKPLREQPKLSEAGFLTLTNFPYPSRAGQHQMVLLARVVHAGIHHMSPHDLRNWLRTQHGLSGRAPLAAIKARQTTSIDELVSYLQRRRYQSYLSGGLLPTEQPGAEAD